MKHARCCYIVIFLLSLAACDSADAEFAADAGMDAEVPDPPPGCNPAALLPSNYRPIAKVATTLLTVTTITGVTSGTADASAGGLAMSADNPYLYLDLKTGVKVGLNDLDARTSTDWDVALKRSSLRLNSGDSGVGNRKSAAVAATTLSEVTDGPSDGYQVDIFATADCTLLTIPGGEPMSAFGEWYNYDTETNRVVPKPEVHVIQRPDRSRTAFRIAAYYDPQMPMRGAVYSVEWKQLPEAP
jgi:HmuY protein